MSIALTDDHRALSRTASEFLAAHDVRGAARALLEADAEAVPPFWAELASLGWLGLHLPEHRGGSGFALPELVVVIEELGRAVAPGPFVPTVVVNALVDAVGSEDLAARLLPGLAAGSIFGGMALTSDIAVDGASGAGAERRHATGSAPAVLGGGLAHVLCLVAGDDVVVVEASAAGVHVEVPANLDPARRSARVTLEEAPVEVLAGGRRALVDRARVLLGAEAAGIAAACTDQAAAYARTRVQFGRPIGTFQAVKHHCANMLVASEFAAAAVWDAARAGGTGQHGEGPGAEFSLAAAEAAVLAVAAADECAQLSIQVHGGIGFTWEHDAHLYLRRAAALAAVVDPEAAARDVTGLVQQGVRRSRALDLPPESEPQRDEVRALAGRIRGLDRSEQWAALSEAGYVMPHWPRPWGRDAGAVEQLVIEQELAAAGITRPQYGITGWVVLTLIQHGTGDQVERWVPPALRKEVVWCQLFSEPDAGSDAAGIKARGTPVEGGWLVNGQKVWTSGAQIAAFGLATVRTDPGAPKHEGITTMVIDMHAEGVEVRPLRMITGHSEFNEVFLTDVFVPDDDVVGPVNGGWSVARATLGNESVSIGGGAGLPAMPTDAVLAPFAAHGERLPGGAGRVGRYLARHDTVAVLNLRAAQRAVGGESGGGGGPTSEGNVTKLVLSEIGHETAAILAALGGPDTAYTEGDGAAAASMVLFHRALSIAGGTSEIKRNQIGERILGLPRDPLVDVGGRRPENPQSAPPPPPDAT